jgi:hypothetical protein
MTERDRLDIRGLLPPNVMSSEQQIQRFSMFSCLILAALSFFVN